MMPFHIILEYLFIRHRNCCRRLWNMAARWKCQFDSDVIFNRGMWCEDYCALWWWLSLSFLRNNLLSLLSPKVCFSLHQWLCGNKQAMLICWSAALKQMVHYFILFFLVPIWTQCGKWYAFVVAGVSFNGYDATWYQNGTAIIEANGNGSCGL